MFGWLRRQKNRKQDNVLLKLPFSTNVAAFEYACQFMLSDLREGQSLPAIVLDASKEHGNRKAVSIDEGGIQTALLLVCSRDKGFRVVAKSLGARGPKLKPNDLVAWQAAKFDQNLANVSDDPRFGWVGFILGTLKPEWDPTVGWVGDQRFG